MLSGKVVVDPKTKHLVKRLPAHGIAVIAHRDLDRLAARSLIEKKVKAVINTETSISGTYPNQGPSELLASGIPLIDNCGPGLLKSLSDGDRVMIKGGQIFRNNLLLGQGEVLTPDMVEGRLKEARANLPRELAGFIDNTLEYASREKELILDLDIPETGLEFEGRQVLIVVRGVNYKQDLKAISTYIYEVNPIMIAVDGAADACLEQGYLPDIIIGDMDSITDQALKSGGELIVHAYPDGQAPGMERIKRLGLTARLFPAPGTSEDIAMLLAYEQGADLITAVGTHSHMIDFLEKGRPGMASTLLVRLKIGNKLVDARGLSQLYQNRIRYHYWLQVLIALLLPLFTLTTFAPGLKHYLQLILLRINLILRF